MRFLKSSLLIAIMSVPSVAAAENASGVSCGSIGGVAGARHCMLEQRVLGDRLQGIQKGSASSAVMDAEVSLRVREQMAEMADERMGLGDAGSGGLALLAPLLVLLVVLGGGSSGNGAPVSPS